MSLRAARKVLTINTMRLLIDKRLRSLVAIRNVDLLEVFGAMLKSEVTGCQKSLRSQVTEN